MEAGFLLKVPGISWQENFLCSGENKSSTGNKCFLSLGPPAYGNESIAKNSRFSPNRNSTRTIYHLSVILRSFRVVSNSAKHDAHGFFKVLSLGIDGNEVCGLCDDPRSQTLDYFDPLIPKNDDDPIGNKIDPIPDGVIPVSLLTIDRLTVAHRVRQNASLTGVALALKQKFLSYQLADPINFIRGTTAGKLDCFRLDLVSATFL